LFEKQLKLAFCRMGLSFSGLRSMFLVRVFEIYQKVEKLWFWKLIVLSNAEIFLSDIEIVDCRISPKLRK